MLGYAHADGGRQLTCAREYFAEVDACSPRDVELLRGEGLSEEDVLSLSEIVAYQNMSTRIMESLSTVT